MLELLIGPKKAERHPWEMFFYGLLYAFISIVLVNWIFSGDAVLSKYSGILIVTFTVMLSMPFMYYITKYEEKRDVEEKEGGFGILKEHTKALIAMLWMFLGFVVAFSFYYVAFSHQSFNAQIETFCLINRPTNYQNCVNQYTEGKSVATGFLSAKERLFSIFVNNIYVLIFTLVFSLIFGAGAIFVLAWNASVISAAIGIFSKQSLSQLPLGLARYMIHGIPEIASYFIAALAGGIISIAIVKKEFKGDKIWNVLQDSLNLIIIAVIILFIAAIIEVFVTPILF